MPVVDQKELHNFSFKIFSQLGASNEEAERVATHLVTNNLMGHDSHGVIHIPGYAAQIREGEITPRAKLETVRQTPSAAVLDGNWGFGHLIAKKATELAINKAAEHSISYVGVRNCNHIGRLGEYSTMAAKQNMVGIISANDAGAGLAMAPFGGIAKRLSPNPISIAFPRGNGEFPVLLDISSTTVAQGKHAVARNRGQKVPEGWAIDAQGHHITDPRDFWGPPEGAILPLGGALLGHKGFGLGFVLDVLDGALSGAGCSREGVTRLANGLFISVIKITDFVPLEEFKKQVDDLIHFVKSSPLSPGFSEILVPGEAEYREYAKRSTKGIMIEDQTWTKILETARMLGIESPI
ncbi:MAG: Ldh family oxidoreductase [Thaumarchaeota archaeon]|nr:Ldh family oxidoreductase [Nitrososphaerota archaeon]